MIGDTNLRKNTRGGMMTPIRFLLFLSIAISFQSLAYGDENPMESLQNMLPAYAVALEAETTLNSSTCARELRIFKDAINNRTMWALKVLDASGIPKPGFMYGNNYWLGSRTQCFDTTNETPFSIQKAFLQNATRLRISEVEFPPFNLNYFAARFRHNSTLQYHVRINIEDVVTLGLCLPASCTTTELSSILERVLQEQILMAGHLYRVNFKLMDVRDLQDDHSWLLNEKFIIMGLVLLLTICMMIAGTAYDVLVYQKYLKAVKQINCDNSQDTHVLDDLKKNEVNSESPVPVILKHPTIICEILRCFSVFTNTKIIFHKKIDSDSIAPIYGMRVLGMIWILLGHTVYYVTDSVDNKATFWRLSEGFAIQLATNATLSVDTFLFMGGFLTSYHYYKTPLKNKKESHNAKNKSKSMALIRSTIKRFIRLTPSYMMIVGIMAVSSDWYGKTSLFYLAENPQRNCAKYWWRNLLYINNLFPRDELCLSWSWYLPNDMQFGIIGSVLLMLSSIYFYTAATILAFILLSTTIVTGYVSYNHGFVPTMDDIVDTIDILYNPPWARIGPYIVGMVVGYMIVKLKGRLTLRRRNLVILWLLGSGCNLVVLFRLYNRSISVLYSAFYMALSRTVWAVGIGWVIIACCTNHAGIINTILSFRGWVPLGRLTYCAYLINPFIISSLQQLSDSPMHAKLLLFSTMFFSNTVITYICSYAYALMMEFPYLQLIKLTTTSRSFNR